MYLTKQKERSDCLMRLSAFVSGLRRHTLRLPPRLRSQTMESTNPFAFLTLRSQPPLARRNPLDETRHGTYLPLAEAHQSGDSYTCVGTPGSSPYLGFVLDSSLSKAPTDGRLLASSSSKISDLFYRRSFERLTSTCATYEV